MSAIESLEPVDDRELDVDLQAVLDEEPSLRRPVRKAKYRPGTREEIKARQSVEAVGSWWMRPNANFEKEAQRMRDQPTRLKVPGEHNIVGWNV